jgi:hypothetical protein
VEALEQHTETKHPFGCGYCGEDFLSGGLLKQHVSDQHPFGCCYCREDFSSDEALEHHISDQHPHACRRCNRAFDSDVGLKQHVKSKHPSVCDYCDKEFRSVEALEQHTETEHREDFRLDEPREHDSESRTSPDLLCSTFSSRTVNVNHAFTKSKIASQQSRLFSWTPPQLVPMQATSDVPSQSKTNPSTAQLSLECDILGDSFGDEFLLEEALAQHIKANHSYVCDYCDTGFFSMIDLDQHVSDQHSQVCNYFPGLLLSPFPSRTDNPGVPSATMFSSQPSNPNASCKDRVAVLDPTSTPGSPSSARCSPDLTDDSQHLLVGSSDFPMISSSSSCQYVSDRGQTALKALGNELSSTKEENDELRQELKRLKDMVGSIKEDLHDLVGPLPLCLSSAD